MRLIWALFACLMSLPSWAGAAPSVTCLHVDGESRRAWILLDRDLPPDVRKDTFVPPSRWLSGLTFVPPQSEDNRQRPIQKLLTVRDVLQKKIPLLFGSCLWHAATAQDLAFLDARWGAGARSPSGPYLPWGLGQDAQDHGTLVVAAKDPSAEPISLLFVRTQNGRVSQWEWTRGLNDPLGKEPLAGAAEKLAGLIQKQSKVEGVLEPGKGMGVVFDKRISERDVLLIENAIRIFSQNADFFLQPESVSKKDITYNCPFPSDKMDPLLQKLKKDFPQFLIRALPGERKMIEIFAQK